MAFNISQTNLPAEEIFGERCKWCEIRINEFSERFVAPIEQWMLDDYNQQWKTAVTRIIKGAIKDYFMASMRDPEKSDFVSVYAMYREEERVYVQNQIIICSGNEEIIRSGDLSSLVNDREIETDDGERISEWETSIEDLKRFVESSPGRWVQ